MVNAAGSLRVSWIKAGTFTGTYGTDFAVETTDALGATWVTEPLGGNVVIVGNEVRYTFPPGAKRFARMKVIAP